MIKLLHFLGLFFLIFNFRLPLFHNSMTFFIFIALFAVLVSKEKINILWRLVESKYFFTLYTFLGILIVWSLVFARLQGVYDDNLMTLRLIVMTEGLIGAMLYIALVAKRQMYDELYIFKMIVSIFVIQAIIQIIAMANHSFFEFIQIFHISNDERAVSEIAKFGGIRGGALAGDLFFLLSISYGMVLFLYIKYILDKRHITITEIITILLFLVGMFTSARIGYVGLFVGFIYYIVANNKAIVKKLSMLTKLVLIVVFSILIIYMILPTHLQDIIFNKLLPFAFEFIYRYIETGEFATSSTSHLLKDMVVLPDTTKTWLIGDGRLMGTDGSYYMHTDMGYSRILFYFGIYGLIAFFVLQLLFIPPKRLSNQIFQKNYYKTIFLIILFMLIVNYKGLSLGLSASINIILILSFLNIKNYVGRGSNG